MTELAEIIERLSVVDQAAAVVQELHGANDYLLSGALVQLLAQRIDLLLKAERLVAGTDGAHLFDGALRVAIDAEQAARSLFAHLARQHTETQEQPT